MGDPGQRSLACLGSVGAVEVASEKPVEAPSYRASLGFSGRKSSLMAGCQLDAAKYDGGTDGNCGGLEPPIEVE